MSTGYGQDIVGDTKVRDYSGVNLGIENYQAWLRSIKNFFGDVNLFEYLTKTDVPQEEQISARVAFARLNASRTTGIKDTVSEDVSLSSAPLLFKHHEKQFGISSPELRAIRLGELSHVRLSNYETIYGDLNHKNMESRAISGQDFANPDWLMCKWYTIG